MQAQKSRKINRIFSLTVLYSIIFFSILLALPASLGNTTNTQELQLYSAPSVQTNGLPVRIITNTSNLPTTAASGTNKLNSSKSNDSNLHVNQNTKNNQQLTCSRVGICEKVRFVGTISTIQKTQYYNAILETLHTLQKIPSLQTIGDTIFSITISANNSNNTHRGDRRGWGGSKTVEVYIKDIKTIQEFREVLTHELGHIIDLGVIQGRSNDKDSNFLIADTTSLGVDDASISFYKISRLDSHTKKAEASYIDFVGGYAMSSPFEDFAETLNAFLWHNQAFKIMAKESSFLSQKYGYMYNLLSGSSLTNKSNGADVKKTQYNPQWRPRDTTRMSIE